MAMNPEIAACGLFCGTCRKFVKASCPGCHANGKATWCGIRTCCIQHEWQSCAECTLMPLDECWKFNNFVGKLFGLVFRSDRKGCIERIRKVGEKSFAEEMRMSGFYNRPVRK